MPELTTCENCGAEVTLDSDFCPTCGYIFQDTGAYECGEHPGKEAIGVCVVCHRLVCQEDGVEVDGRLHCTEHEDVLVQEGWGEVFVSTDGNEAEMVKAVLESNGILVTAQGFGSIGFVWDGGGDSALSRSQLNKPARVFVPLREYIRARQILDDWESSEPN